MSHGVADMLQEAPMVKGFGHKGEMKIARSTLTREHRKRIVDSQHFGQDLPAVVRDDDVRRLDFVSNTTTKKETHLRQTSTDVLFTRRKGTRQSRELHRVTVGSICISMGCCRYGFG